MGPEGRPGLVPHRRRRLDPVAGGEARGAPRPRMREPPSAAPRGGRGTPRYSLQNASCSPVVVFCQTLACAGAVGAGAGRAEADAQSEEEQDQQRVDRIELRHCVRATGPLIVHIVEGLGPNESGSGNCQSELRAMSVSIRSASPSSLDRQ